jgi:uncharacterized RDD family membrane protein YckC
LADATRADRTVTPEAVAIEHDVAGLGSRLIALLTDSLIQFSAILILILAFNAIGADEGTAGSVMLLVLVFLIFVGYFPLFEGLWNGRTPGKRLQRLRVVRTDGQPVTWAPVLVRNALRLVDILPTYYMAGAITILLTKRSQRLGDLAAGTIVVRERPLPTPVSMGPVGWSLGIPPPPIDTAGLTEREYDLIRSFLERRASLRPEARAALAAEVARVVRPKVPAVPLGDEALLEAAAAAYRTRFGSVPPPLPPD